MRPCVLFTLDYLKVCQLRFWYRQFGFHFCHYRFFIFLPSSKLFSLFKLLSPTLYVVAKKHWVQHRINVQRPFNFCTKLATIIIIRQRFLLTQYQSKTRTRRQKPKNFSWLMFSVTWFGEISPLCQYFKSIGQFVTVYITLLNTLNLFWSYVYTIGQIFIVVNGQMLKK